MPELSPEHLSALAGLLLSLLFSYVPGLSTWYDAQGPTTKRLIMLGLLLVVALGSLLYRCRTDAACFGVEWEAYLAAFIAALITNQAAASITPLPPERRAVRARAAQRHMPAAGDTR
jgi:hypothetical protein